MAWFQQRVFINWALILGHARPECDGIPHDLRLGDSDNCCGDHRPVLHGGDVPEAGEHLPLPAGKVWLTEESRPYCLISRFGKDIADRLITLNRELGVTYFKWDGVDTYNWGDTSPKGCDAADHGHGDKTVPPDERAECAAFMFPLAMVEIVERINEACPQAIIDFDITEAGRAVGLSFLSAGKYFLVNNGPYFH